MNKKGENANGAISKYEDPLFNVSKTAEIKAPTNKPDTNKVFFFFLVNSSVDSSLKFSFAIVVCVLIMNVYYACC
jgi:hypothetical protein